MKDVSPKYEEILYYVTHSPYKLHAICAKNGSLEWSIDLLPIIGGVAGYPGLTPILGSDGTIYVVWNNDDGGVLPQVIAINPNGTEKWVATVNSSDHDEQGPDGVAIGSNGSIYVGNYNDPDFHALNPNGTLKWTVTNPPNATDPATVASAAIGPDGRVYVTSNYDNKLIALNTSDGMEQWSYDLGGTNSRSAPVVDSAGFIYVGSNDNKLYAVKVDGSEKWTNTSLLANTYYISPAVDEQLATPAVYIGDALGNLYAFKMSNGDPLWDINIGQVGFPSSSPAIGPDGTVYIGSTDNHLYAINPLDGSEKWKFDTSAPIYFTPTIGSDGTIYISTAVGGTLYAITDNGVTSTQKWSVSITNGSSNFASKVAISHKTEILPNYFTSSNSRYS